MPVFIVDPEGNLLYYNEAAEKIFGRRFKDTGSMAASVWSRIFVPTDESGNPLMPEALPLMIAMTEMHAAYSRFWIRGIDNVSRHIEVAAFPIISKASENLGSMAIFWETRNRLE